MVHCIVIERSYHSEDFATRDDDVLNEDWMKYRMVRSHGSAATVLVAIGVDRRIQKRKRHETKHAKT
jgi:hypothetical protein